jgi:hypothetical protein
MSGTITAEYICPLRKSLSNVSEFYRVLPSTYVLCEDRYRMLPSVPDRKSLYVVTDLELFNRKNYLHHVEHVDTNWEELMYGQYPAITDIRRPLIMICVNEYTWPTLLRIKSKVIMSSSTFYCQRYIYDRLSL